MQQRLRNGYLAERRFLTTNEDGPTLVDERDGIANSNDGWADSEQTPHRRVPKQISHKVQAKAERSAAVPVGQASTTLLSRSPLAVRRQLPAPRSPPRLQTAQSRFEEIRLRQRPFEIRRAQVIRVPLSQADHIRKPTLFTTSNLNRSTPHKDVLESTVRQRTVPLPPVEPPRHWARHRARVRLRRPTNKHLTDLRAPPRVSTMNRDVIRGEAATSADLISDSDVEKAVLQAIIESSTTSSRKNGRIHRPSFHRLSTHSSNSGSADIAEGHSTTAFTTFTTITMSDDLTTTTAIPNSTFDSTENDSTQETTTNSTPFPLTSLQDVPLRNVIPKEELNENLIEDGLTPTLTPPPSSPSPMPVSSVQEIGAPGAAPPNDSVVEALNRAENFMEVARRLRILRSEFPQQRQRRWAKIDDEVPGIANLP
nr:unnamed protein product [Haemonchus contortus]